VIFISIAIPWLSVATMTISVCRIAARADAAEEQSPTGRMVWLRQG
jgi:hypothetical protein